MQNTTIILLGLAVLAYARIRSRGKIGRWQFGHLRGWQKIFGVLAIILTVLIILNPDTLAFGLIGDTAFFDMLVLVLSLQMSVFTARACHGCVDVVSSLARWLGIPSPGLCWLLAGLTPLFAGAVAVFQKALHRILA